MNDQNTKATPLFLACALALVQSGAVFADKTATGFHEPFDTLDGAVWFVSDGWTNGAHQNCTWSKDAVTVVDGVLRLTFLPGKAGDEHLCGEVQTNATFHYGTYEARVRTPAGSGLNAAFFTYIGPVHKQPHDEIDFEVLTRDTGSVSLNTFVDGAPQNGKTVPVDPPTDAAFHDFAFIWSPDSIRWFIDGVQVHEATENLPVTPQKLYLSFWGSDTFVDWMGPFTAPPGPLVMDVDWTAFTPMGEAVSVPGVTSVQDALIRRPADGAVVVQVSPNAMLCFAALMSLQLVPILGTVAALGFMAPAMVLVVRRPGAVTGEILDQPLVWGMVGWCILSVLWSDYPADSLRHGLQLAVTVLFATTVAARMPPLALLKAAAVSVFLACAASLASGRARADGEGFLGIYSSKNAMASASLILLIIGLCLVVDRQLPRRWRGFGLAAIGLGGVLLVRANSVGALVAMAVVGATFVAILGVRRLSGPQRLVVGVLAGLGILGGGLALAANFEAVSALFLGATGKDVSLTGRTDLWQVALDEIARRPWLGAGYQAVWVPGNPIAEMLWTDFGVESRTGFHFHNAYLSNAVEIGVIGVAMQVLLVLGALIGALAWVLRDLRAETLFLALFMVRQVFLSFVEVPFFLQFDVGTILTVAALVYVRHARSSRHFRQAGQAGV